MSQPALSKQVREVEALLGVTLFERARPRTRVTPDGAPLIAQARRVLIAARDLVQLAAERNDQPHGPLHIGVIPTVAPYLLPGLLAELRSAFPRLKCALHELQTRDLLRALRDGEVGLALLAETDDATDDLHGATLLDEPFVLVAPRGHRLDVAQGVGIGALRDADLLLMDDGHCLRQHALDVCALAGVPTQTTFGAASVGTLLRMVESGLGVTLVPATALVAEPLVPGALSLRAFEDAPPPSRRLIARWRATNPRAPTLRRVVEHVRAHGRTLDARLGGLEVHGPRLRLTIPR